MNKEEVLLKCPYLSMYIRQYKFPLKQKSCSQTIAYKSTYCFQTRCTEINSFTLYPWIHQWTNNKLTADQTQPITFPDVDPSNLPPTSDFSMAAGDFLEVYQTPGKRHVHLNTYTGKPSTCYIKHIFNTYLT